MFVTVTVFTGNQRFQKLFLFASAAGMERKSTKRSGPIIPMMVAVGFKRKLMAGYLQDGWRRDVSFSLSFK